MPRRRAMDIHAAGGDQRGLRDQQQNPERKRRTVQVNDQTGQRRMEHPREIVRARKSDKHRR